MELLANLREELYNGGQDFKLVAGSESGLNAGIMPII